MVCGPGAGFRATKSSKKSRVGPARGTEEKANGANMLIRKATRPVRDFTCDSRRRAAYKPREGDVIIATAPKVGTTWMQQIVSLLIFQSPKPRPLDETSPWIDCRFGGPGEQMLDSIEVQTHRGFLKSHLSLDALPIYDEVKYIHVARDGRDACMSLMNQLGGGEVPHPVA